MATKNEIKAVIQKFHANPQMLDDLLDVDKAERIKKLKAHGADKFKRKEVKDVMEELLLTPDVNNGSERLVEWVGAIAAAAAGAMAA